MNYDDIHSLNREKLILDHKSFLEDKRFLEFGVFKGTSMLMWYDLYRKNDIEPDFVGFDSFCGLPHEPADENSIWHPGQFNAAGINPELLNKQGIQIIPGFFSETLNMDMANWLCNKKVGLVHFDCDLYTSTMQIWEWLLEYDLLSSGAIIVYDDWGSYLEKQCGEYNIGEAKAHKEIEFKYKVKFVDLGSYIVDPKFYIVKIFRKCDNG